MNTNILSDKEKVVWWEFANNRPADAISFESKYIGKKFFPRQEVPSENIRWSEIKNRSNGMVGFLDYKSFGVNQDQSQYDEFFAKLIRMGTAYTVDADAARKLATINTNPALQSKNDKAIQDQINSDMANKIKLGISQIGSTQEYLMIKSLEGRIQWPPLKEDGSPFPEAAIPSEWNPDYRLNIDMMFDSIQVQNATTLHDVDGTIGSGQRWDHIDANPVKDIQIMKNILGYTSGYDVSDPVLIMSTNTLTKLCDNPFITEVFNSPVGDKRYISPIDVSNYVKSKLGVTIVTYDAVWTYPDPTNKSKHIRVRYLDKHKVIMLPTMDITLGYLATTLQEDENEQWVSGINVFAYKEDKPPYHRFVAVSEIAFPVMTVRDAHVVLNTML